MNKTEMTKLLVQKIETYGLFPEIPEEKLSLQRLSKRIAYKKVEVDADNPYLSIRNSAIECGEVLLDDKASGSVDVVIKAGVGNMNPAFVIVRVSGKSASIAAFAKEGLINQHTADKAIARLILGA